MKITLTMESDEGPKRKGEEEFSNSYPHARNIFQPSGFRHLIQDDLGFDKGLLAYNWYFLPCISFFIWCIFLVIR